MKHFAMTLLAAVLLLTAAACAVAGAKAYPLPHDTDEYPDAHKVYRTLQYARQGNEYRYETEWVGHEVSFSAKISRITAMGSLVFDRFFSEMRFYCELAEPSRAAAFTTGDKVEAVGRLRGKSGRYTYEFTNCHVQSAQR